MGLFQKSMDLPTADTALPGREQQVAVPEQHFVNGRPMKKSVQVTQDITKLSWLSITRPRCLTRPCSNASGKVITQLKACARATIWGHNTDQVSILTLKNS